MLSQRKLIANRQNAQKSTGPKTKQGKQNSRQNSTRHGLRSRLAQTIVPQAEKRSFQSFQDEMLADLNPLGPAEHILAQCLVLLAYKLQRCSTAESLLFDRLNDDDAASVEKDNEEEIESHHHKLANLPPDFHGPIPPPVLLDAAPRQSSSQLLAGAFHEAHDAHLPQFAAMIPTRAEMFIRLQRYTTSTERSFNRTLREYLQLQKLRRSSSSRPTEEGPDEGQGVDTPAGAAPHTNSEFPIEATESLSFQAQIDPIEPTNPSQPPSNLQNRLPATNRLLFSACRSGDNDPLITPATQ